MTAALTEDWGVGETTAALIADDVYGGHVLTAENTLCRLAMEGLASPGPFLHLAGSRGFVEELGLNGVVAADMNAQRAVLWELGSLVTRCISPASDCSNLGPRVSCQLVRMNIMLGLYGVAKIN